MNLVGAYVGNVASNWIETTIEGAKDAATAYGGNLAGDIVIAGGNLVETVGRTVGNSVSGYASGYGTWVNGYGDKLKGAPPSSLPKSGPLATYKAGGTKADSLKRSASFGPISSSSSKALTKSATSKALAAKKTVYPAGAKSYNAYRNEKKSDKQTALTKAGNAKYPTSAPGTNSDRRPPTSKPDYPKGPSMAPGGTNAFSSATSTKPKEGGPYPSGPYPSGPKKDYSRYKLVEKDKPKGLASKAAGGGHIPLPGGFGGEDAKSTKGYKPYTPPSKGPEKDKPQGLASKSAGGGHIPLPGGFGSGGGGGGEGASKGYKPYTAPSKGPDKPSGGAASNAGGQNGKLDRTFF